MADVRSMLKASREARRITHPNAAYTKDGKLLCNLCNVLVKSEAQWQGHLGSNQHNKIKTQQEQTAGHKNGGTGGLKRKANASPEVDAKKKLKPSVVVEEEEEEDEEEQTVSHDHEPSQQPQSDEADALNADEMLAFEQQLQELERSQQAQQATISAPAMTAEEVAAQAREEQSTQREKRAAEVEAEREDAKARLEEEFEEMEGLEARARKLRERVESVRRGNTAVPPEPGEDREEDRVEEDGGKDDEDDDEDDFDEWKFGAR